MIKIQGRVYWWKWVGGEGHRGWHDAAESDHFLSDVVGSRRFILTLGFRTYISPKRYFAWTVFFLSASSPSPPRLYIYVCLGEEFRVFPSTPSDSIGLKEAFKSLFFISTWWVWRRWHLDYTLMYNDGKWTTLEVRRLELNAWLYVWGLAKSLLSLICGMMVIIPAAWVGCFSCIIPILHQPPSLLARGPLQGRYPLYWVFLEDETLS